MKDATIIVAMMIEFAERTGLATPNSTPRRYLWTDAFATI